MRLKTYLCLCVLALPLLLTAQEPAPGKPQPGTPADSSDQANTPKRIFGIMPNYKTVEKMDTYRPISTREKFHIASEDSFDWPQFAMAGAVAGLNQLSGQSPEWGQGVQGFAKRYGAAVADQTISNFLTEAILPSALHHDPRYFRMGAGHGPARRIVHALSWVVIGKTDTNRSTLNVSELLGSGAAASIGLLYYPKQERDGGAVRDRFVTQIGFDAVSSVLKEYWPDIRHKFFKR
jgi:hypothetical protein